MFELSEEEKFFTISTLSKMTGIAPHSIRRWELEFKLLTPVRTQKGHRRYTENDVEKLLTIKDLIYRQKMTLEGAKKYLSKRSKSKINLNVTDSQTNRESLKTLVQIDKELSDILKEW
ncbi:MAG TPA: MerR family transcriptional regulator [Elusimicrobiales bacterium]|nr:MerR family transcriptional regulator [Elusimicrobiales bacterium]